MPKKEAPKGYIAVHGIDFEGLKDKPHVEPGDPVPEGLDAKVIDDLLACRDIEEAK